MPPSIRKLTGRIGAVVEGVDLTATPDLSTVTALRDALNTHKAIVFDHVDLDNAGQERVARWFGELTTAHPNVPATDGTTNVLAVDSETSKANEWHTDVTFVINPPQLTTLRSIVTTPYGGETLIANAAAAYRDLPAPLRALADTLRVVHTNQYDYARPASTTAQRQEYDRAFVSTPYEAEHPVVRVHPLTGERGLFIGGFAKRIVGLPSSDSADLLRILQSYVTRPENILSWTWSPNQLLIFDNRITQHYAVDNYDDHPRRLNRVTVAGEVPAGVDGRRSEQLVGDASHYSALAVAA
ncbi:MULTISPECIES: TauD/TfdA family dioxygenase [Streptomyces]|uniref:Taurine catabolism dioxygenase n=1 Tax=Streptomyces sviceus (strain ATCC 29083 / DSM 924 / JCM 4929 / NBRC 13980 / NCIMB 11184 / NRRL 5439 / UC 5370) TaxID=463191 RepID=B5HPN8_STRX2|nr:MULTISPECIES: TauD/TfdA family dioxygenase [Streptomyces]EDY54814.1 taurine catabolism dioxygenase [Streptomyces sviceus ATCC 29083]MYT10615.1 TauD/TfdA family dioxygenase [Streptomyces sp. SID5470]